MELGGLNFPCFTTCTPKSWVEKSITFQVTKQAVKQQQGAGGWVFGTLKNRDDAVAIIAKTIAGNNK